MKEVWENRDRTELKTPDSIKTFLCAWFTHLFRKEKVWTKFTLLEVNIYVSKRLQKSLDLTGMVYEDPGEHSSTASTHGMHGCCGMHSISCTQRCKGEMYLLVTLPDSHRLLILQAQKAELDARRLALSALTVSNIRGRRKQSCWNSEGSRPQWRKMYFQKQLNLRIFKILLNPI